MLLFAFIFVMALFSSSQKSQLENEQERLTVNLFKKEAMRIYVEDCLRDSLEEALILIGKQGKLWKGQPGGNIAFSSAQGVLFSGDRIYYGVTTKNYIAYKNAYPCDLFKDQPEEFCKYVHTDRVDGFGELRLNEESLKKDLRDYLENMTVVCVENFTRNNISNTAKIESTELNLSVDLQIDGISVQAEYPLKFSLGGKDFFQLSTFDFFYPTQFKLFLESTLLFPLSKDNRDLNFSYDSETIRRSYIYYDILGIEMNQTSLSNGDDIFTFTPNLYTVLNSPTPYYFRFARQNRPPALDYIQRYGCPQAGYDYLVINGDGELGNISIRAYALDPDDPDSSSISFCEPKEFYFYGNTRKCFNGSDMYRVNRTFPLGTWVIPFETVDPHGIKDWQNVRVLVDRSITVNLSLTLPYNDTPSRQSEDTYFVSREDPFYLNITYPANSSAPFTAQVNLDYSNGEGTEDFSFDFQTGNGETKKCLSFPSNSGNNVCTLSNYPHNLSKWFNYFSGDYAHLNQITSTGNLNLSFSIEYCDGELNRSRSSSAKIQVKGCTPHVNPERPYAYPFQDYKYFNYDFDRNIGKFNKIEALTSSLESTHSCCLSSWNVAPNNTACFVDPQPKCYGKTGYGKTILEVRKVFCDGERGNVCGGKEGYLPSNSNTSYPNPKKELICGKNGAGDCSGIDPACEGKPAFGLIKDVGWCTGTGGCKLSSSAVVYFNSTGETHYEPDLSDTFLISNLTSIPIKGKDPKFPYFLCSVPSTIPIVTKGYSCDSNFDGIFGGTCDETGACIGDN